MSEIQLGFNNIKYNTIVIINGTKIHIHHLYDKYGSDSLGIVYNLVTQKPIKGYLTKKGYFIRVSTWGKDNKATIAKDIFIYECHYPNSMNINVIHIDGDKTINRLENLMITP